MAQIEKFQRMQEVVHVCNPSTGEVERGRRIASLKPVLTPL
jgi:hypothetical protein